MSPCNVDLLGAYLHLARHKEQRCDIMASDRMLVLAGALAAELSMAGVAEVCRQRILSHNPGHRVRQYESFAEGLQDSDFRYFVDHLRRRFHNEELQRSLSAAGFSFERDGRTAHQSDLEYLGALLNDWEISNPIIPVTSEDAAVRSAQRPTVARRQPAKSNIRRDVRYLVVPLDNPVFPLRCVKTGVLVKEKSYRYSADIILRKGVAPVGELLLGQLLFGAPGRRMADAAHDDVFHLSFRIGLSPQQQRRRRRNITLAIGVPLVTAAVFATLALSVFRIPEPLVLMISLGLAIVSPLTLTYLFVHEPIRRVKHNESEAWFSGAGDDFLDSLPDYRTVRLVRD